MRVKVPNAFPVGQVSDPARPAGPCLEPPVKADSEIDSNPDSVPSVAATDDQVLADLVEELAARLHAGGSVDWYACAQEHPQYVKPLRELLPALEALAGAASAKNPTSEVCNPKSPNHAPQLEQGSKNASNSCLIRVPSATTELDFGQGKLGDFRLIREVGRGGMGVVYEAEQISLSRRVALKILPFAAALDSRHLQRFKTEAQAAAQLHHTNIVPVYAVGCEQGTHYYAMQFIEGQTLASVIHAKLEDRATRDERQKSAGKKNSTTVDDRAQATRPSNPDPRSSTLQPRSSIFDSRDSIFRTIATLGIQAAEALEYAHQMGVVHRDIKPANLLVDIRGNLWITDFGLARLSGWATPSGEAGANVTGTGDVLGTLRYMSPEQAAGKRGTVDHRSDIYSLGVTLYECLTLQPAISGQSRQEVLSQVATEEPIPPRRIDKAIPIELETIILKALAKNSDDRYPSAQELADDLRRFLEDKPIRARRPSLPDHLRKWARRHQSLMRLAGVFALLGVAGLIVSFVFITRQRNEAEARGRQARRAADEMYSLFAEGWLSRQPGMEALEKEFLLKALAFYEEFARENGSSLEILFETGKAFRRMGDIHYKLGEFDKAKDAFLQAADRLDRLSSDFPANNDYRQELALAHNNLGNIERDEGRLVPADQSYQRAERSFEILFESDPQVPEYRDGLAGIENNRGIVLTTLGRLKEAEQSYRRALALLHELDQLHRSTYRHDLAGCLNNLGNLLTFTCRFREAESFLCRALPIRIQLAAEFPTFPAYRQSLALLHTSLGALFSATDRYAEAAREYQQSQIILEKLSNDFPAIPIYRRQNASNSTGLGCLLTALGKVKEAQAAHREALALRELPATLDNKQFLLAQNREGAKPMTFAPLRLSARQEQLPSCYLQDLAASHSYLGRLALETGQVTDAERALRQALQFRQQLAADAVPCFQHDVATSYHHLANLMVVVGRLSEAETTYRQALAIDLPLVRDFGESPSFCLELASCQSDLGAIHIETGRFADAETELRKSLVLLRSLGEEFPEIRQCRGVMVETLDRLSRVYQNTARTKEAEQTLVLAVGLAEKLTAEAPTNPDYRRTFAHVLIRRGERMTAAGHTYQAHEALSKALTLQAKLADGCPQIPRFRSELAHAMDLLGCLLTKETKKTEAAKTFSQGRQIRQKLIENEPGAPAYFQELAWFLATCPDVSFWDARSALSNARRAVALGPEVGGCWSALGVAHFRTGDWKKAEEAFQKAIQLKNGGTCADWLFLAMTCRQLGDQAQARRWLDQGIAWIDQHHPVAEELTRFRAEAEGVMLGEQQGPPPAGGDQ